MQNKTTKTMLVVSILSMAVLTVVLFGLKYEQKPEPTLTIEAPIVDEKPDLENVIPPIIQKINERNASIRTFSCESVVVKTWDSGIKFRLTGDLRYEKDTNFRLVLKSFFGKELDLGSNKNVFWYWSRRDPEPGLYYADYKDYKKTRLKTAFNPMFLQSSLGIKQIETKDAQIIEKDSSLLVIREESSAVDEEILHITFVNKTSGLIEGFLITDMNQNPIASCEIQAYSNGLPTKILYAWYQEDKVMLLELKNPRANDQINSNWWKLPDYTPQINMAEE